jgi:hypothetical protein
MSSNILKTVRIFKTITKQEIEMNVNKNIVESIVTGIKPVVKFACNFWGVSPKEYFSDYQTKTLKVLEIQEESSEVIGGAEGIQKTIIIVLAKESNNIIAKIAIVYECGAYSHELIEA